MERFQRVGSLAWTLAVVAAGVVFWGAVAVWMAPPSAGIDTFAFKEAGCNLAAGQGLTAFGIQGHDATQAQYYSTYPPGLAGLFGVWAAIAGCGQAADAVFELGAQAASMLAVLLVLGGALRGALPHRGGWTAAGLALLLVMVFPGAMIAVIRDRPEQLAMPVFALALVLAARGRHRAAALVAGACFWLHPYVAIAAAMAAWLLAMLAPALAGESAPWRRRITPTLAMVGSFVIPVLALIAWSWLQDPQSLHRFVAHARSLPSGARATEGLQSFSGALRFGVFSAGVYTMVAFATYLCGLLAIAGSYWLGRAETGARLWHLGLLVFALTPLLLFPAQHNYLVFTLTAILMVMAMGPARFIQRRVILATLVVIAMAMLPFTLRELWSLHRYQDDFARAKAELGAAFAAIPAGTLVAVPAGHYFLIKPWHGRLINADYFPELPAEVGVWLDCPRGRFLDQLREVAVPTGFEAVQRSAIEAVALDVGGLTSARYWGWRCDVYRRVAR